MTVIRKTIGSVYFEYLEEYDSEEQALEKTNGKFLKINLNKLRLERVKILKKENDGQRHQDSEEAKTKGRTKV
tara:strand:- start:864 stop:1082 length:219 start_codon:yes stop_codon:yes gene_type:complete